MHYSLEFWFYNFQNSKLSELKYETSHIYHFKLFKSGESLIEEDCNCLNIPHKQPNTVFETLISSYAKEVGIPVNIKLAGYLKAKESNAIAKNCFICRFYGYNRFYGKNICSLYLRYQIPMEPIPNAAETCNYYVEDNISIKGITSAKDSYEKCKFLRLI